MVSYFYKFYILIIRMKRIVIPSIIAKNQNELNNRISKVESSTYQLDIMDGKFVKNKSLMFDFSIQNDKKYEAHLMILNPKLWIEKNHGKVDTIIFHLESTKNPEEIISLIKSKKKKVGIAVNPGTSIEKIDSFLNKINTVLIMTVNPGRYGSKFLPKMLDKVKFLKKLKPKLNIEVDGGIDNKTIHKAFKSGANSFIVGSYLQKSENPKESIKELRK